MQRSGQRSEQEKWLRKMAADTARQRLARARAQVREAQAAKRTAVRRAREACRTARVAAREWIARSRVELREEIARMKAELAARIEARRAAVRKCCGPDRVRAREEGNAKIAEARAYLLELQSARRTESIWSRPTDLVLARGGKRKRGERAREVKAEKDHEVESNLTRDEVIVYRRAKREGELTMTPAQRQRMTATEHFQQWMHDNSALVEQYLLDDAERGIAEAIKNEEKERREWAQLKKARDGRKLSEYVRAELEAVPF